MFHWEVVLYLTFEAFTRQENESNSHTPDPDCWKEIKRLNFSLTGLHDMN